MPTALLQTDLGSLPLTTSGKVRDIYALQHDELLFVATDRISAFDQVLGSGIPDKGKILTQLSLFWFDFLKTTVPNHLISAIAADFPPELQPFVAQLDGRSMLVKRAKMFPVECVVRGYLSGSGWKDYQQTGAVCGIKLPAGLPEPIFTPAAKNNVGHDENISFARMVDTIGQKAAENLRSLTLAIYEKAGKHAASKGLILADTKFEFGQVRNENNNESGSDQIILADEVLTPDSSRYWPAETYNPGGPQPSFDKQYVRDYLESIHWNKQAPSPSLPDEVVARTREKYLDAFRAITGHINLPHTEAE